MSVLVTDRNAYAISHRERTEQGYLKVPGRVARAGIQTYTAGELGIEDRAPGETVRVYRPPEEVFSDDSLSSYDHVDVTNDHPSDMVTADSFRDVAVGHVASRAQRDGDYVVADLLIKDRRAIDAVESGKAELSAGYSAEYEYNPGKTQDGEDYEYVQRGIRINHIALVDRGRAGREARLYDTGDKPMGKTVTLDKASGNTVEVADEATAKLIQQTVDSLHTRAIDAEQAAKDAQSERDELQASKDKLSEDNERLKQEASDEALAARVKEVADVQKHAAAIAGDTFTCDSVNPMEIRRQALKVVRPAMDWDDKSDSYVQAAFDMETTQDDGSRARRSHDGLGDDLAQRYTGDGGVMIGTAAYSDFLSGKGAKH